RSSGFILFNRLATLSSGGAHVEMGTCSGQFGNYGSCVWNLSTFLWTSDLRCLRGTFCSEENACREKSSRRAPAFVHLTSIRQEASLLWLRVRNSLGRHRRSEESDRWRKQSHYIF